ncbi:hypothetical protein K474DRAFT_1406022 [Panus rudis PR-1116 ss-1]|nr:hypothetical protein K474DRAFT_1406022 [Panus rudis PR-1116 ss-1]
MPYPHSNGSIAQGLGGDVEGTGQSEGVVVVNDPMILKRLVDEQFALGFERCPKHLIFRILPDGKLKRLEYEHSRATISEGFLHNVFSFLRQLRAVDINRFGGSGKVTLTLQGVRGINIPESVQSVLTTRGDNDSGLTFEIVRELSLLDCSFESLEGVHKFFEAFPLVSRFKVERTRWPACVTARSDMLRREDVLLNKAWSLGLEQVSIRVSSFGDVWLVTQIHRLMPQKVEKLVLEWSPKLQTGYMKDILPTHIDLRQWPSLHTLVILNIPDTTDSNDLADNDGSALTIAAALLPTSIPDYNARQAHPLFHHHETEVHRNWLNTVVIDLRNVSPGSTGTGSGSGSRMLKYESPEYLNDASKLREEFDELLAQLLTLKHHPAFSRMHNGICTVVGLVPTPASASVDPRVPLVYQSELHMKLTAHGILVEFKPVD